MSSATQLPDSATVVIIGGGVIGLSCAFRLAKAGVSDVVLLERDSLGSGSTSRAAGGVRAQFSNRANIELSARSLDVYRHFTELFDQEVDFCEVGYLFLLTTRESVLGFEASVALQNELGVPSRMISASEAKRLSPLINTTDVLAASFCPTEGHCAPDSVVLGFARAARGEGATLISQTEVLDIEIRDGEIEAVVTSHGPLRTNAVVCAAGAWSSQVGEWIGLDLPVVPVRRQVLVTEPLPHIKQDMPLTVDLATTLYFHRSGRQMVIGMSDPDETSGYKLNMSDNWLPRLGDALAHRVPELTSAGIATGWAGLYEVTPDHNALIGEAEGVNRFIYATGFSGHGFLMAPAIGEVVRDLYFDKEPFTDVSGFSASRFSNGESLPETNVI
jgi:sarcosine oxidase, subunit beta